MVGATELTIMYTMRRKLFPNCGHLEYGEEKELRSVGKKRGVSSFLLPSPVPPSFLVTISISLCLHPERAQPAPTPGPAVLGGPAPASPERLRSAADLCPGAWPAGRTLHPVPSGPRAAGPQPASQAPQGLRQQRAEVRADVALAEGGSPRMRMRTLARS